MEIRDRKCSRTPEGRWTTLLDRARQTGNARNKLDTPAVKSKGQLKHSLDPPKESSGNKRPTKIYLRSEILPLLRRIVLLLVLLGSFIILCRKVAFIVAQSGLSLSSAGKASKHAVRLSLNVNPRALSDSFPAGVETRNSKVVDTDTAGGWITALGSQLGQMTTVTTKRLDDRGGGEDLSFNVNDALAKFPVTRLSGVSNVSPSKKGLDGSHGIWTPSQIILGEDPESYFGKIHRYEIVCEVDPEIKIGKESGSEEKWKKSEENQNKKLIRIGLLASIVGENGNWPGCYLAALQETKILRSCRDLAFKGSGGQERAGEKKIVGENMIADDEDIDDIDDIDDSDEDWILEGEGGSRKLKALEQEEKYMENLDDRKGAISTDSSNDTAVGDDVAAALEILMITIDEILDPRVMFAALHHLKMVRGDSYVQNVPFHIDMSQRPDFSLPFARRIQGVFEKLNIPREHVSALHYRAGFIARPDGIVEVPSTHNRISEEIVKERINSFDRRDVDALSPLLRSYFWHGYWWELMKLSEKTRRPGECDTVEDSASIRPSSSSTDEYHPFLLLGGDATEERTAMVFQLWRRGLLSRKKGNLWSFQTPEMCCKMRNNEGGTEYKNGGGAEEVESTQGDDCSGIYRPSDEESVFFNEIRRNPQKHKRFCSLFPKNLDMKLTGQTLNIDRTFAPEALYNATAFSIVFESHLDSPKLSALTEKPLKAIAMGHPFVLLFAAAEADRLLTSFGFQDSSPIKHPTLLREVYGEENQGAGIDKDLRKIGKYIAKVTKAIPASSWSLLERKAKANRRHMRCGGLRERMTRHLVGTFVTTLNLS